MSYLITSNTSDLTQAPITTGINKPFTYFNNLNETYKIPIDSEIAVQSLKYNKQGNIEVNRANNQFYLYLGTKPTDTSPISDTTSHPNMTWITDEKNNKNTNFNTDSLASAISRSLKRGIYHPNWLPTTLNAGFPNCTVKRNASGVDFQGFTFVFKGSASSDNASQTNISDHWRKAEVFGAGDIVINSGIVFNNFGQINSVIGVQYPLSLTGGVFNCSLGNTVSTEAWEVGLTRCTRTEDYEGTPNDELEAPSYFRKNRNFFDYVVSNIDSDGSGVNKLKLYHSAWDVNTGELAMTEVDYRTKLGIASYMTQNGSNINRVRWTCTNEQVKCELINTSGSATVIADGLQAQSIRNLKPINQCCWTLYPKLTIPAGKEMKVNSFNGIDLDVNSLDAINHLYGSDKPVTEGLSLRQSNTDWWATQVNLGREFWCAQVDSRFMIHAGNTTTYTQLGLNANGGVAKDIVMVLSESSLYSPSRFASAQRLLGFQSRGVVANPNSQSGNTITFISDEAPNMISTDSVFVRLKNMTFDSVNFSKKSTSKILYHVPRFDNAGNEFNSLFFEPNERVYLKLNNVQEIFLNSMEVELVNADETLATNITGKTICCFHIRECPKY